MGEPNQVRWVGIRPTDPEEDIPIKTDYTKASVKVYASDGSSIIPVSDRRLKLFRASVVAQTVSPDSSYDVMSVSGAGKVEWFLLESHDVPADDAKLQWNFDETGYISYEYPFDLKRCEAFDMTNKGFYQLGSTCVQIYIWDTTNNVYQMRQYRVNAFFGESLVVRFRNSNTASSATIYNYIRYYLFTSSKVISLRTKHDVSKHVHEIRHIINKDYKKCDAVIWQIESVIDEFEQVKEKNIAKLHIIVDDDAFERLKDKIINRLIKERMVCL